MKVLNQVSLTELGITLNYATNEINFWTTRLLEKKHLDERDKKEYEENLEYWTEVEETASFHIEKIIKLNFVK